MTFLKSLFPRQSALKTAFLLAGFVASLWMAAQADEKPQLSEAVSGKISDLYKKLNEKSYDAVIAEATQLIAGAKPNSYDIALLSQLKVQGYLYKSAYTEAIAPLETALSLGDRYKYFERRQLLELRWLLAQLYAQEAATEKSPDLKRTKYSKAYETVRRWLSDTPTPTVEALLFAASILYTQAVEGSDTPDLERLGMAEAECRKALLLDVKPREQIYTLLVASLQMQSSALMAASDNDKAGDKTAAEEKRKRGIDKLLEASKYLELLVEQKPTNSQYWPQLLNPYLIQAESLPEGTLQRQEAYAKAIITIERAQKMGFLKSPDDHFRLVGIYFNSGQFEGAIDLLSSGLKDGQIEPTLKNWELLAQTYVQIKDEPKAIKTYLEISKLFPKEGTIDMQIGNLYYNQDKYEEALGYMQSAVDKGVPRPGPLQFFVSYLLFELKKIDEASVAIEKALAITPDSREARDLKTAIDDAIKERDFLLRRHEAQQQGQPAAAPAPASAQTNA
jgi:tetratricopeptide (TPR) repeat protein